MMIRRMLGMVAVLQLFGMEAGAQLQDLIVSSEEQVKITGSKLFQNVAVHANGELRLERGDLGDPERSRLEIVAERIEIESLGRINASEVFGEPVEPDTAENTGGYGGSYGGKGGAPTPEDQLATHGNPDQPNIMRGSHGGDGPMHTRVGGLTGGAVTLRAETVVVNGEVSCNGMKGEDWSDNPALPEPQRLFGAGGGSGGGILILAKTLTIGPNARITANGGNGGDGSGLYGGYEGYPGGGGRIKIFYQEAIISESAVIEAKRGIPPQTGSYGGAEDGTVHIQQVRSIDQLLNPGDLNGDGVTDHEDLFILQQSWQQSITPIPSPEEPPTPTATPEP